jgi:hypothetical protein
MAKATMGQVVEFPGGAAVSTRPSVNQQYLIRHHEALQRPRGIERPIVALREGLLMYATEYAERFEGCELGKDYVIGKSWVEMARGYLGLLNCETGRLDCGTLDGELRRWAVRFGFAEEL